MYLKLPWIGNISLKFENKIKSSVKHCFRAVEPRVLFSTQKILPSIHKDAVPSIQTKYGCIRYTCAAVIAGTWVAHLYVWRKRSINMFLILSEENSNQQKFYQNENAKSDLQQLNSNAFQPLDSI